MKFNERKLHFIENYLKVNDAAVMSELEKVLKKSSTKGKPAKTFKALSGVLSKKDARELEKIIEDGCETIDANEWK